MPNNFLKQLTILALCGFMFLFGAFVSPINVLAQDSLDPDYAGAKCPMGQILINNKCFCNPDRPTFKACIKKLLKDKKQKFQNAILESAGDAFIPGSFLVHTVNVGGTDYLDVNLSVINPVIYVGQDNNLLVENIRLKDGEGQLVAASLIQTNVTITTPSGRKITLKVVADMTGSYMINLSPKLKGLIQQAFNPLGTINVQAAENVQYTLLSGDLRDLEQLGDYTAYITVTNGGRELASRTVPWKTIQDPGLVGTAINTINNTLKPVKVVTKPVVDVLSRTGVNSSTLLAGVAMILTAALTYSVVNRKSA
jgi:hypothetical protein